MVMPVEDDWRLCVLGHREDVPDGEDPVVVLQDQPVASPLVQPGEVGPSRGQGSDGHQAV